MTRYSGRSGKTVKRTGRDDGDVSWTGERRSRVTRSALRWRRRRCWRSGERNLAYAATTTTADTWSAADDASSKSGQPQPRDSPAANGFTSPRRDSSPSSCAADTPYAIRALHYYYIKILVNVAGHAHS